VDNPVDNVDNFHFVTIFSFFLNIYTVQNRQLPIGSETYPQFMQTLSVSR